MSTSAGRERVATLGSDIREENIAARSWEFRVARACNYNGATNDASVADELDLVTHNGRLEKIRETHKLKMNSIWFIKRISEAYIAKGRDGGEIAHKLVAECEALFVRVRADPPHIVRRSLKKTSPKTKRARKFRKRELNSNGGQNVVAFPALRLHKRENTNKERKITRGGRRSEGGPVRLPDMHMP